MNFQPTPREIETWYPTKWSQIVGNVELKEHFKNMTLNGAFNCLITGPNGSGKTRACTLWLRSMLCANRTVDFDPCGKCNVCKYADGHLDSVDGLFVGLTGAACCVHMIDCQTITASELKDLCRDGSMEDPRTIVFLDELAALARRELYNEIKTTCENSKASWVGASVTLKPKKTRGQRQPMVQFPPEMNRRFSNRIGTEIPQSDDLVSWIKDRCKEWNIHCDDELVVADMVGRTNRVRHILEMLVVGASKPNRTLTRKDVKKFNLVSPD